MNDPIEQKVNQWVQDGDSKYTEINRKIEHLNDWLFHDYEPAIGSGPQFFKRLAKWLDNTTDVDYQKLLFELVPHIFYVGREELNVLYREAYQTVFAKWLIDLTGVSFTSPTVLDDLNKAVEDTWFCPLTDSLRINQFYHINDIPGKHDHRPDWRSLRTFGDIEQIKKYIIKEGIKRIVLLEDFIGNGTQISKTVEFTIANLQDMPILVVPLIICPKGMEKVQSLAASHNNIKIDPVLAIPKSYFVHAIETDIELDFFKDIHGIARETYTKVSNSTIVDENDDPYGPFGWRKTGGIIVLHTNTPNNTLPLIHNKSKTWEPLFKRHKRI